MNRRLSKNCSVHTYVSPGRFILIETVFNNFLLSEILLNKKLFHIYLIAVDERKNFAMKPITTKSSVCNEDHYY